MCEQPATSVLVLLLYERYIVMLFVNIDIIDLINVVLFFTILFFLLAN